jgi:hypothetical protein
MICLYSTRLPASPSLLRSRIVYACTCTCTCHALNAVAAVRDSEPDRVTGRRPGKATQPGISHTITDSALDPCFTQRGGCDRHSLSIQITYGELHSTVPSYPPPNLLNQTTYASPIYFHVCAPTTADNLQLSAAGSLRSTFPGFG